ncbi:MAG: hypothetical protein ACTSUE_25100 [Promethearchaeota archaeon]
MTLLTVIFTDELGKAIMNPDDCAEYDFLEGDLMLLEDEDTGNIVYCYLFMDPQIPKDTIALGQNLIDRLGIVENDTIEVDRMETQPTEVKEVIIEFESQDYDPETLKFDEGFRLKAIEFLRNYHFNNTTSLYWPEEHAFLRVTFADAGSKTPPYYISNYNDAISVQIQPKTTMLAFNAILAIDCSGSMKHRDICFGDMNSIIDNLTSIYNGEKQSHRYLCNYLNQLKPQFVIHPEEYKISRLKATFISILMFFNQKISRGLGEKCSVILYSDKAINFRYHGIKGVFDSNDFTTPEIINELLGQMENPRSILTGITRFSPCFNLLRERVEEFSKTSNNPILILFLTDGKPVPADLDPKENIYSSVREFMKYASDIGKQVVIFTLGIGDEINIDKDILENLARIGNGSFHYSVDFQEISSWFERLAGDFSIHLRTSETNARGN